MNFSKIFLISTVVITSIFCAKQTKALPSTNSVLERQIDNWLLQKFSPNFYDVGYTPDLFNQIKKELLAKNYIQYMPHKELKEIVKSEIIKLQKKRFRTEKWVRKNKKSINETIKEFVTKHKHTRPQDVLEHITTCKNKTCENIQNALKDQALFPELIKKSIKKQINEFV